MNLNKYLKIVFLFFLFLSSLNFLFAGNVTYTDSSYNFYADMWNTKGYSPIWDSHIFLNSFIVKGQLSTGFSNTINYPNSSTIEYAQVLLYPETTEDFTLKHQGIDLNTSDSGSFSISQKKYRTTGDTIVHLDTASCNIEDLSFDLTTNTLTITSNLNPFQVYDWNTATGKFELKTADFSNSDTSYFTDLLNRYYHMKSTVIGKIYFNNTLIETIYEDDMTSISNLTNLNGDNYINYSYIEPLSDTSLTFSNKANYLYLLQTYNNYGTYTFEFEVTPVDLKCDFDSTNALESDEFTSRIENFTLQIRQPNTPTISSPSDSSTFQGGNVNVTSTISDPDDNDLTAYFLVDGNVVKTQTNVTSGSTITGQLTGLSDGFHNLSLIISDLYTNITSSNNVSILMETPPVGTNIGVSSGSSVSYDKNRIYNFYATWTDFNGIDEIIFNFDGTNYTSISNTSSNYSINFSDLAVGNYSYQWFGNDTQGSDNESSIFNLEITRATPVLALRLNNLSSNITTEVNTNVSINATESITDTSNINLYENGVLINFGNGSLINTTAYSIFNQTNNLTVSYTQSQNYTSGSLSYFITTVDTIKPQLTNLIPNGSSFTIGDTIEISVNATDNYEMNSVIAQISLPNGTTTNLTLTNQTYNKYNNTYTIPNLLGTYNITFIASDHINNINNSETTNFSTLDVTAPLVNIVNPIVNDLVNTSDVIEISVNVTDEISISTVIAQVDFNNGTSENITLTNAFGAKYNGSFTAPQNLLGLYNITIIATDSSNNINNSEKTNFSVLDNIAPKMILNNPNNTTDYNIGDTITINSSVTDNINVDFVYATINYPNSTSYNLSLDNSTLDIYNNSLYLAITGIYNITIYANDSSNNINNTQVLSFNVSDFTNPNVTNLIPVNGSTYNITNTIEILSNVSDLSSISNVLAQIDYSNGTSINLSLTNVIGNKYNNSFTIPNLIGRFNITIIANDSFNNINASETTYFNVLDNINPNVTILVPVNGTTYNITDSIEVSSNVSDEIAVSKVIAQIDYPNSTSVNLTLINTIGNKYNSSFTIPELLGRYNVTIIANDSSNNINNSVTTYFNVIDSFTPNVNIVNPTSNSTISSNTNLEISSNVTDQISISTVIAQIDYPNSTSVNLTLINTIGNKYNNSFTIPELLGRYNVTIIANDSSNNINNSETTYFNVVDTTNPNVTLVSPSLNSIYNITNNIVFSVNSTDNIQIDTVYITLNLPNSSIYNYTLTTTNNLTYNTTFTIPNLIGLYNITFIVNDTSNNINNSVTSNFTVLDNINPNVTSLIPTINSVFNNSNVIEVSSNVSDEIAVSKVIAQIDYPNSTSYNYTLTKVIGDKYNNSFTIPTNLIGLFNITIIANDSSNNINNSVTSNFTVLDNINPSLIINSPINNSEYNYSNDLILNTTITDNILINKVYANVTLPNSTVYTITLINFNNSNQYNNTFTPTGIGNYSVIFFTNDSSSNTNISEVILFSYVDVTNPSVINTTPIINSNYNLSNTIEISANISDDILVDSVYTNINYPNGTTINLSLTNVVEDKYNNSFIIPSNLIGRYNITYVANDTTNNINNSVTTYFNVLDNINPNVSTLVPVNGTTYNITDSIEISSNVSDEIAVSKVIAQIDYSNSTSINLTLINTIGNKYNSSFTIPELLGRYNVTIIANDSSNNINGSETTYINVVDSFNPIVLITNPLSNSTSSSGTSIEISSNVTDQISVSTVIAQIDYPNSSSINVSLTNSFGNKYNNSFTIPELLGRYNVTIIANDSSNNINDSETTYFNVVDTTNPNVTLVSPSLNSIYNITNNIVFSVNSTDNILLDLAYAQLNLPNSSIYNYTLTTTNNITYNYTYSIPNLIGLYNITYIVNDSSNNINNSITTNFTVLDNINPNVTALLPIISSIFNTSDLIEISANVTDEIAISNVIAQIDYPNSTSYNYTLNGNGNKYNNSFTIPTNLIGLFNITIIANDSSNNINNSVTSNFTVNDNINPEVSLISPQINSNLNISSSVIISINATDNILINNFYTTISYPNSSMYNLTLTSTNNTEYNYIFTIPNLLGLYNLTFTVNDSSNNINNSIRTNFTTIDNINPNVTTLLPANGTTYNITEVIQISSNVTDEIAVSKVIAQIDYPNSTSYNYTLNGNGNKYNNSFTIPNIIGRFNVTFIVNDSSNNINNSETTYFNSVDLNSPNVTLVSSENGTNISIDDNVLLSVNVSDDIQVSSVKTQIDYPNSTAYNYTLTTSNNNTYNFTFTIPKVLGRYNLTYIATDSSNNINNSIITYFNAIDNTNPNVTTLVPSSNTTFNVSDSIEMSSVVVDDLLVDSVIVNISYPNGTNSLLTLLNQSGNKYNSSFLVPNVIGRYNLTIISNDSSNNINNSETSYFNAIDLEVPIFTSLYPRTNTSIRANSNFNITLNVSDNVEISNVYATVNYPNTSSYNLTLNNLIGNNFTNSISINNLTGRYNITFTTNDTSNNILINTTYFIVTLPNITSSSISKTTVANSSSNSFFISAQNYDELYANVTLPDLNVTRLNLTNGQDTTFTNVSQVGDYNVTLIAIDSAKNIRTANYTFKVFDSVSFTSNITGFNGTTLNGTFDIIYNGTVLENGSLSGGNVSQTTVNTPVALLYKLFNNKISIKFNNLNLSQNNGKYFYSDNYENTNGYLTILGVNTSYNFTNATITITYNDSSVGTENDLKLFYCSNYNFNSRTCIGSFTDITSSGTLDTSANTYTFTATGFSAYGIKEVTPTSSGSSGGGGGGGSSSRTTVTEVITEPTIVTNETCSYDWVCSEWNSNVCPLSGVQTRTCRNIGTCSGDEGKPTETRTCSDTIGIDISMINELFHKIGVGVDDIHVELDISYIVRENNLSINDSLSAIYQLLDLENEIKLEDNRIEEINQNETIIYDLNTREVDEGEYLFRITLISNNTRYVDSKNVIIANKELYVDPVSLNNQSEVKLSGNFLQDTKLSVIGIVLGVLVISVIIVSVNAYNKKGRSKPRKKRNKSKRI